MELVTETKQIKINGSEYTITEPGALDAAKIAEMFNNGEIKPEDTSKMIIAGIELVEKMGLPKEVSEKLTASQLMTIIGCFRDESGK